MRKVRHTPCKQIIMFINSSLNMVNIASFQDFFCDKQIHYRLICSFQATFDQYQRWHHKYLLVSDPWNDFVEISCGIQIQPTYSLTSCYNTRIRVYMYIHVYYFIRRKPKCFFFKFKLNDIDQNFYLILL